MKERPILFSAPMVRAILAGTKTQTRRIMKPQPERVAKHVVDIGKDVGRVIPATIPDGWQWRSLYAADGYDFAGSLAMHCPYGIPGDRMWVREAFAYSVKDPDSSLNDEYTEEQYDAVYRADADGHGEWTNYDENLKQTRIAPPWRPSIHMPRWASRITLENACVRVERLHDISEADAKAEGADPIEDSDERYRFGFCNLWFDINGAASWHANPWVWVVEFKRIEQIGVE